MPGLEAVSVALILVLIFIALGARGFSPDMPQLTFSGATISTIALGVIVAIFSQVGFEAATAFGQEAKNLLGDDSSSRYRQSRRHRNLLRHRHVHRDDVAGQRQTDARQANRTADDVGNDVARGYFAALISATQWRDGEASSRQRLVRMNSGARVMWAMGKHGAMHDVFASTHHENETPAAAITVMAALEFTIPTMMIMGGLAVTDAFNDAGTFGAIGFSAAYIFISVAAPMYLKKLGELKPMDIVIAGAAVVMLAATIVFGFFIPPPAPPVNYFPYIFIAYFLIGFVCFARSKNKPSAEMMMAPMPVPGGIASEVA